MEQKTTADHVMSLFEKLTLTEQNDVLSNLYQIVKKGRAHQVAQLRAEAETIEKSVIALDEYLSGPKKEYIPPVPDPLHWSGGEKLLHGMSDTERFSFLGVALLDAKTPLGSPGSMGSVLAPNDGLDDCRH